MTPGPLQDKISSPIRRLNFSNCGDYILVDGIHSTKVIPIPKTMSNEAEVKAESLHQTQAPLIYDLAVAYVKSAYLTYQATS